MATDTDSANLQDAQLNFPEINWEKPSGTPGQAHMTLSMQDFQVTSLEYPHLSHEDVFEGVEEFYKKFFFRPKKIAGMLGEMLSDWQQLKVRLGEARDFFGYMGKREDRVTS